MKGTKCPTSFIAPLSLYAKLLPRPNIEKLGTLLGDFQDTAALKLVLIGSELAIFILIHVLSCRRLKFLGAHVKRAPALIIAAIGCRLSLTF